MKNDKVPNRRFFAMFPLSRSARGLSTKLISKTALSLLFAKRKSPARSSSNLYAQQSAHQLAAGW